MLLCRGDAALSAAGWAGVCGHGPPNPRWPKGSNYPGAHSGVPTTATWSDFILIWLCTSVYLGPLCNERLESLTPVFTLSSTLPAAFRGPALLAGDVHAEAFL